MISSAVVGFVVSLLCATAMGLVLRMRGQRRDQLSAALQRRAVVAGVGAMLALSAAAGLAIAGAPGVLCGLLGALPLAAAGANDLIGLRSGSEAA